MSKQEPMLMESPLTNRVFVVTSYVDNRDGTFTARQKYDVTEQFDALAEQRRGECVITPIATGFDMGRCSACGEVADVASNYCWKCGARNKAVKR